jgi:hypothetical protein
MVNILLVKKELRREILLSKRKTAKRRYIIWARVNIPCL